MTSTSATDEELRKRIARLERRLERERKARQDAETIADRRMRELWLANRELDERVAERTRELEEALEELEAATAAGAAFIGNLSHEMLTPLNGIVGMLELLEEHAHSDSMRSYVATALTSSDRLHRLLRRLLDLVELRAGRMVLHDEVTTVRALADRVTRDWQQPSLHAGKLLSVRSLGPGEREFITDSQRVLQIAGELVQNTITHADPGVVTVEIDASEPAGRLSIAVEDAGPGFDWAGGASFWSTFLKLDLSPGRATEGAGVGLGIAAQLAERLGGTLMVESGIGRSTVARLELPIKFVTPA